MDIDCSAVIDGHLLVAGRKGLFEVEKGKCRKLPNTEALEGKEIRQMLPFGKRRMIVCTSNLGTNCHIGTGYASLVAGDNLYIGTNQGLFAISYPLGQGPTPPVPADVAGL